eukprot:CAMPEP_0201548244 /NCGR_PEP_ID=MMETSP0173_2-20130828/4771_1 /ASSEMBLY_ACC=CAM_ASM_000268 /TAXON_ID=218659 /ORGANISM="Vexillifera sp., Strain DIVA3 564/2" /LENGTH=262 /DNA_ID=CAMNT_0047957561 /DNA_START=125 /DNA_END=913 /DNA_ORIENTATION=-
MKDDDVVNNNNDLQSKCFALEEKEYIQLHRHYEKAIALLQKTITLTKTCSKQVHKEIVEKRQQALERKASAAAAATSSDQKTTTTTTTMDDDEVNERKKEAATSSVGKTQGAGKSTQPRPEQPRHLAIGSRVAAKVRAPDSGETVWILASVVQYYRESNRYKVEDAEVDELELAQTDSIKYHILDPNEIIALPDASLGESVQFRKGESVLAMFPNTSSFYPATFVRRSRDTMLVQFEDDEDETGQTPERSVHRNFVVYPPQM